MLLHTHRLFIALLAWRFGVVPLLLGGVFARVHDNLDSGLVYHVLGARFWAGGLDHAVLDLPMNGVLDWTHFASLTWPLQMIYAVAEPGLAYALTELVVVVTGYVAMFLLLQDIARNDPATRAKPAEAAGIAALMACLFAMTLAFSTLGLGVAAAPLVVLLCWRRLTAGAAAGLFFIGWNSGLIMHAMFLPVVVALLSLALGRGMRTAVAPLAICLAGSVLGSAPLFAHVLGGEVGHRSLWPSEAALPGIGEVAGDLAAALVGQFPWYHATVTPALHTLVFLVAGLLVRGRAGLLLAMVPVLAVVLNLLAPWQGLILPPILASLQYDRIGQFAALLVIALGALVLLAAPSQRAARWVRGAAVFSLVQAMLIWSGMNSATLRAAVPAEVRSALRAEARENGVLSALAQLDLSPAALAAAIPTVPRHMRQHDYTCIARVVGNRRVASAGPDPMLAPLNGIAATDGYHYLYPADWHAAFRPVIAAKLAASADLRAYYDGWGSRVSLFIDRVPEIPPDFAALHALGTDFVIADRALPLPEVPMPCALTGGFRLYRLGS